MKSPLEKANGRIVGYDEQRQELLIRVPYSDWHTLTKRQYKTCVVQLVDSRPVSSRQRRCCYALLGGISDETGMGKVPTKEYRKRKFLLEDFEATEEQVFSLATASMSLVCAFQRFLIRFILDWDIPVKFSLLDMVDDVPDYIYSCLRAKKCVVCGREAELHRIDRAGEGRRQIESLYEGLEALPLCSEHHTQAHSMSNQAFFNRYHLSGGIILDSSLCCIWDLQHGHRKEV